MMGISWTEFLVIAIIALIVIGPKELPSTLRSLGRSIQAIRKTAAEFQAQFDQFVRDSEIESMRREAEDALRDADKEKVQGFTKPPAETPPAQSSASARQEQQQAAGAKADSDSEGEGRS